MGEFQKLNVTSPDGTQKEATVVTFFKNSINGKTYVLYTFDNTNIDEVEICASIFKENSDGYELSPIETDIEWEAIQEAISNLTEEG